MPVFGRLAARVALLSFCFLAPARAQLIPVKTIPLAQGNQFQMFPSANLGMASVGIALPDPVFDAFVNPAAGARIESSRVFGSPVVYSVTQGTGGGRTLPLALLMRRASWYGGLALAVQQVDPSRPPQFDGVIAVAGPPLGGAPDPIAPPPGGQFIQPDNRARGNRYAFGMLGHSIPSRHWSIGASVLWNGLHAVDGVDLLYAGSRRISQSGHALDVRLGAIKDWPGEAGAAGRSLEAVLLHNRFAATHDVVYADQFWNPNTLQFEEQARNERNLDHTNTWGLQLKYQMPLAPNGWRIGWLAVANRASHPKIPTYELVNVPALPRDPGYTHAYNLGVGVSRVEGSGRFGLDLVYEPISSYTWADAATPVLTAAGNTIPAGGKTIENRFRFANAWVRFGVEQAVVPGKPTRFQLGLILHPIQYWLTQHDHVQLVSRRVSSGWVEWTPTWGLSYRQPAFELRYQGRATKGAGRPSSSPLVIGVRELATAGSTILAPPNGPMFMTDVSTVTHQISISLPLH